MPVKAPRFQGRGFPSLTKLEICRGWRPADLAKVFLKRSIKMLKRLSTAASAETLEAALCAPSDVGGVASLMSAMAPLVVEVISIDPLAEAIARGAVRKQELLREAGGALTSSQVADALGISRQAVDKQRIRRACWQFPTGSGEYLYPACQFTDDGVVSGFEEVLRAFRVRGEWTQLSVLLSGASGMPGKTVLDVLRDGDAGRAVALASAFGEQGG